MSTGFDRQLSRAHRPMGGVNAIRKINGLLMGGADPRRSSYAIVPLSSQQLVQKTLNRLGAKSR